VVRAAGRPRGAYTKLLGAIEPGEVLTPSPLLTFEGEYVRLHFQRWPDGRLTSPQVPTGDARRLAESAYVPSDRIEANSAEFETVCELVSPVKLDECVARAETNVSQILDAPPAVPEPPAPLPSDVRLAQGLEPDQQGRSNQEWLKRQQAYVQTALDPSAALRNTAPSDEPVAIGPLVPFWIGAGGATGGDGAETMRDPHLVFARNVRVHEEQYVQGFLCDWPRLRAALLEEIADLLPAAGLVPVITASAASDPASSMLATIPARLDVPPPAPLAVSWGSPAGSTLLVAWGAVLAGLVAVAVTLRASIALGERRGRFASAVTHELRTPLTTFRMYSEMLAEDMVPDAEQRRVYLRTLKDESDRLAALVENVLAYARLERGRAQIEPQTTTLGAVLDELVPALARRAARADMELVVERGEAPDTAVYIDPLPVGQILHNLVDNACKYAEASEPAVVELRAEVAGDRLRIAVRDHGPGIPREHARAIFSPFERGARGAGDPTPGVGLGLALARGLARRLGGDLRLEDAAGRGASFVLEVPARGRVPR
jgi:signal transduction histidine kinase